jgi:hypothetical protein
VLLRFTEAYYLLLSWYGGAEKLAHLPLAWVWLEYGKADVRWQLSDPTIMSMEFWTVCVVGPLCIMTAAAIFRRSPWRHVLQLVVCVSELYGGWMTFAPEWLSGSQSLDTSDAKLLYERETERERCTIIHQTNASLNQAVESIES